ncbi:MAG: glycosyltransferase [Kiritimatiellae bacterium]|nr:glycosyltransferase [Kiritimatiellia bacterium]
MTAPRVVHWVHDLIRGGTEGQCARVAMGLAKRGLPHRVAVFHRRGFFLEGVEAACGPVHEVRIRHAVRWNTWKEIRRLAVWLRDTQADILHAWDADAAIFGQFAAGLAGVKLVTSRRDLGQIYPAWKTALMRRADQAAVRVVANAGAVRDHFAARGLTAEKMVVLPNLLDLAEFDAQSRVPFSKTDQLPAGRRLVVVNRLDPEKNTGLLIEALPLVRRRVPDAVLVVAGDGREMEKLRARTRQLGLESAVCFLGEIDDVPALLGHCEIGALVPGRNEGLSNTILEYMAAGRPVLATDCGGNRELVKDGVTGILLPAHPTVEAVASAWAEVLGERNGPQAYGRHAREAVARTHAMERVLDGFVRCYDRIAGKPS